MNERLGIFEELQALRITLGPFAYAAPQLDEEPDDKFVAAVRAEVREIFEDVGRRLADIKAYPRSRKHVHAHDLPETEHRRIKPTAYTVSDILEAASKAFNITLYAIISPARNQPVSRARFAVVMLLREKREMSFPRIGHSLKRDHTSAMHGYSRAIKLLATDPEWAERYHAAERLLKGEK